MRPSWVLYKKPMLPKQTITDRDMEYSSCLIFEPNTLKPEGREAVEYVLTSAPTISLLHISKPLVITPCDQPWELEGQLWGCGAPVSLASTRLTMLETASLNFSSSVKMGMLSDTTLSIRSSPTACRSALVSHHQSCTQALLVPPTSPPSPILKLCVSVMMGL